MYQSGLQMTNPGIVKSSALAANCGGLVAGFSWVQLFFRRFLFEDEIRQVYDFFAVYVQNFRQCKHLKMLSLDLCRSVQINVTNLIIFPYSKNVQNLSKTSKIENSKTSWIVDKLRKLGLSNMIKYDRSLANLVRRLPNQMPMQNHSEL